MTFVRRRESFTLIEMLMVLVVIAILAMMIFKMMGAAGRSSNKSATQALILSVAEALEEFRAQYGQYPACRNYNVTEYKGAFVGNTKDSMTPPVDDYFDKNPGDTKHRIYEYGLYWYLVGVGKPPAQPFAGQHTNSVQYRQLSKRDEAMLDRWRPHLTAALQGNLRTDFVLGTNTDGSIGLSDVGIAHSYALYRVAIWDRWKNDLAYECGPPYQTYKLYSAGPDGAFGTPDDIHATTKWDAR